MSDVWYYVQGSERVGPVERPELAQLYTDGVINSDSYVWKKGFDNWIVLREVDELADLMNSSANETIEEVEEIPMMTDEVEEVMPEKIEALDLSQIGENEKRFSIKVGVDRGGQEAEYGPFSLTQLKKAYEQKRINEKTYIFTPGMDNWVFLADFELYKNITGELPPELTPEERRRAVRKPFIAKMFFHDNSSVYEGICRDISVGGLQILVAGFPTKVGDKVSMNVHPDNSDHCFTASGVVVRKLEGDSGFSLRFDELSESAKSAIDSYIHGQS